MHCFKRLAVLLTLCAPVIFAEPALATDQIREEIVVEGRVQRMTRTPLLRWMSKRKTKPWKSQAGSTNCWRGYVGRWLFERDQLFLVALQRRTSQGWVEIPLEPLFGKAYPVPATWFTDDIYIPLGNAVRRGRRRRNAVFPKTLHVEFSKGRVESKRVIDHRTDNALMRSFHDLERVAKAWMSDPDDREWHDARSIGRKAFQEKIVAGTSFRTRGLLMGKNRETLYIPESSVVKATHFRLEKTPPIARGPFSIPAVEIEATWKTVDGHIVLTVSTIRKLHDRESMHHPAHPPPDGADALARRALEKEARDVTTPGSRDVQFGAVIRLQGPLQGGKFPVLMGVDVAGAEPLVGKPVQAVGILERWIVTQHELATNSDVAAWVGTRGPGEYFRLVDLLTGELVRPQSK